MNITPSTIKSALFQVLEYFSAASKKYKGYTLMAVDGSDLNLPAYKRDTVYRVKPSPCPFSQKIF